MTNELTPDCQLIGSSEGWSLQHPDHADPLPLLGIELRVTHGGVALAGVHVGGAGSDRGTNIADDTWVTLPYSKQPGDCPGALVGASEGWTATVIDEHGSRAVPFLGVELSRDIVGWTPAGEMVNDSGGLMLYAALIELDGEVLDIADGDGDCGDFALVGITGPGEIAR